MKRFSRPTNEELFLYRNIYLDFDTHFVIDFWDSYNPIYYFNQFHLEQINDTFLITPEERHEYFKKVIKLK